MKHQERKHMEHHGKPAKQHINFRGVAEGKTADNWDRAYRKAGRPVINLKAFKLDENGIVNP